MDRAALKVLTKIMNEVCDHFTMDYDFYCPKYLKELFDKKEYQEAHAKFLEMILCVKSVQRKGDEKLLKAIFGEDYDVKELEKNNEEIEDDEENDCNNCDECTFKFDCDESYYEESYKSRLAKEYWELDNKYEKLTDFIMKVEQKKIIFKGNLNLLKLQAEQMCEYLQTLQKRAIVENIELGKYRGK